MADTDTNSNTNNHIAILGGTFDPIHNGHLKVASLVSDKLNISPILFIPNNIPPHRAQPKAVPHERLAMLELALEHTNNQNFIINTCEIDRNSPSYMVDTIAHIKSLPEYKNKTIWLILGQDAFYNLSKWHNWEKLSTSCNFIVLDRKIDNKKDTKQPDWLNQYLKAHLTKDIHNTTANTGAVYFLHTQLIPISASKIREHIASSHKPGDIDYLNQNLPKIVLNYIINNNLYR